MTDKNGCEKTFVDYKLKVCQDIKSKETRVLGRGRCKKCWHDDYHCICSALSSVPFTLRVQFLIYQHFTDYLNAGDDAKLLISAAPSQTKLFVHGREGDDELFAQEIQKHALSTVLLFPSDKAIQVEEYMALRKEFCAEPSREGTPAELSASVTRPLLRVLVIDATWRHAKAMHRRFCQAEWSQGVTQVQLSPHALSVYSRKQSQPDRICTVEAVALLLECLGEAPEVCERLIEYVKLNTRALRGETLKDSQNLYSGVGGHPAWYFGRRWV